MSGYLIVDCIIFNKKNKEANHTNIFKLSSIFYEKVSMVECGPHLSRERDLAYCIHPVTVYGRI